MMNDNLDLQCLRVMTENQHYTHIQNYMKSRMMTNLKDVKTKDIPKFNTNEYTRPTQQNYVSLRFTLFWDITQRRMVILHRRFGTTYQSHLQGSRSQRRPLTLEDGSDRGGSLKSRFCRSNHVF
jgi:hypothetical protein